MAFIINQRHKVKVEKLTLITNLFCSQYYNTMIAFKENILINIFTNTLGKLKHPEHI